MKPKRGATEEQAKHRLPGTLRSAEQRLEAAAPECGSRSRLVSTEVETARRQEALDERAHDAEREKPLNGGNPGRGSGMKQARKADGGASRREVEKT